MTASLNYPYSPSKLCSQAPKWACRKTEANGVNPAGVWGERSLEGTLGFPIFFTLSLGNLPTGYYMDRHARVP